MASSLDKTVDISYYVRLLWRRRSILLLCVISTLCAALIALAFIPSEYESEVTLMIEESQLLSVELEKLMGGGRQQSSRRGIDEERLAKLVGRIRSRPFLERVIRLLKMNEDPVILALAEERRRSHPEVGREELAIRILLDNLQSRIRFSTSGPTVYKVIVADFSAENAQVLARWISELFVEISDQDALERIKAAHEFGGEQLRIYEQQLRHSEAALERYRKSIIEQNLTQNVVRGENLAVAEALHRRIADETTLARVRLKPYSQTLAELGLATDRAALLTHPGIDDLARSLTAALQNEISDRLAGQISAVGDWPPPGTYRALRQDLLQRVEAASSQRYPNAAPEMRAALAGFVFSKVDLEAEEAAAEMLGQAIANFKRQAGASPGGEIELARLTSEVEMDRRLLQSFQAQLVASDVSRAVEMTKLGLQIEILDPARLPLAPSRPDRLKLLLAAVFLGSLLGVGVAFLSETVDPVLRSLDDFAKVVPEPILGTTPLLAGMVDHRSWLRRHWVVLSLITVILATGAFFTLRSSLLHSIATTGVPVQVVNPESVLHEHTR